MDRDFLPRIALRDAAVPALRCLALVNDGNGKPRHAGQPRDFSAFGVEPDEHGMILLFSCAVSTPDGHIGDDQPEGDGGMRGDWCDRDVIASPHGRKAAFDGGHVELGGWGLGGMRIVGTL